MNLTRWRRRKQHERKFFFGNQLMRPIHYFSVVEAVWIRKKNALLCIDTMRYERLEPSDAECVNYRLTQNPYKYSQGSLVLSLSLSLSPFYLRCMWFFCLLGSCWVCVGITATNVLTSSPGVCFHSNFITRSYLSAFHSHIIPPYISHLVYLFSADSTVRYTRPAMCAAH